MAILGLLKTRAMKFPRPHLLLLVSMGVLALFLMVASLLFLFHPIGSTIHGYLLGMDHLRKPSLGLSCCENQTRVPLELQPPLEKGNQGMIMGQLDENQTRVPDGLVGSPFSSVFIYGNEEMEDFGNFSSGLVDDSEKNDSEIHSDGLAPSNLKSAVVPLPSPPFDDFAMDELRSCDLYHGKWVYDPAGPVYTNNTCPILIQSQNCQGNGRPDKDYENWKWKPDQCDLPRFDARKFLELMKDKSLAFVGDSLSRNHMESMLCSLWQVEKPKRRKKRWIFKSTSTTIYRLWSAWLVRKTTEPLPYTPQDLDKIYLDIPDDTLMEYLPKFDVLVISSGHWFSKPSAYLLKGKIVGGQLWRPKRPRKKQIDSVKAFGIAVETTLTAIAVHPNYTGLTIVRTYSPDHYTGGAWNTGGFCGRMDRPASNLIRNEHTEVMYEKEITSFEQAAKKVSNGSKMRLMDITEVYGYRHDGHPGPYHMARKRDSNGKPSSEDCVHWCMPGPVDTWNEILFEILRREL